MCRQVLHINVVNFLVSVSRALNPKLSSYPVAVATNGAARRVLLDVSQQAFEAGLRRGMLLDSARRTCRDLVVITPSPGAYEQAHRALIQEAARLSPRVESAGPGHVFIDLTGTRRLFGRSVDVADRLRKEVTGKYNLFPTLGLAANKLVSKIATRVIKPVGFCSVISGCEQDFMAPLPIDLMPGIDPKEIQKLVQFNILIIKDLHVVFPDELAHALGSVAFDIYRFARGIDNAPVRDYRAPLPAVEEEVVLRAQTNDEADIGGELFAAASRAGMRLRRMGLAARHVTLRLVYADGKRAAKAYSAATPLCGDITLFELCMRLLRASFTRRIRLSSVSISCTELSSPYGQMDLFLDGENERKLMPALDSVREKFGSGSIRFGG